MTHSMNGEDLVQYEIVVEILPASCVVPSHLNYLNGVNVLLIAV